MAKFGPAVLGNLGRVPVACSYHASRCQLLGRHWQMGFAMGCSSIASMKVFGVLDIVVEYVHAALLLLVLIDLTVLEHFVSLTC